MVGTARKAELMRDFQRKEGDTGSCEVQTALLTERINGLTGHLQTHESDHASRRGLLILVGKRRALLDYLKRQDQGRYQALVQRLGVRR